MSPLSSYKPKPNLCIGTATLLTQPPRHKGHPAGNPEADNNDATLHDMDGNVQQLMQSLEESITANWKKNHHSHSHPHPRHHPTAAETTYRPYYGSYHPTLSQSRAASPTPSVEDASPTVAEGHHEQEDGRISPPSPFDYTPSPGVQGKPIAHHRRALKDQYDVVESRAGFFDMTVFDIASLSDRDARRAVFSGDDSGPDRVESASESEDDRAGPAAGKRRSRNRRVAAELSLSTIADDPETRLSPHPTLHHTESIEPVQLPSEKQEIEPAEDQILTEANTPKTETPTTTHKEKKPLSHFNRLLDPLIAHIHKTLPQRVQRRLHKVVVAWFLTILVCLIHPIQEWVGPVSYLATTAIVFFHPARTLGAQIEATIMGLLGTLAGMIMSWAGLAASTAYNSAHLEKGDKGGRAILAAFLFVSVFVVTWARGRYPRFFLFGVMSAILTIFTFTKSVDLTTFSTTSILDFARPLFLGAVLSLLVNLILWRESASQGLGRALNESLTEIRTLLDLTTSAFLLDPARLDLPNSAVDDVSARMRQALAKVLTAYGEARYEISYGYARGTDFKDIKKCVSRLTQHLSSLALSLHNEKFLLEARKASVAVPKGLRNLSEGESDEEEEEDQEKEVMRRTVRAIETLKEKRDREEIDEDDDSRPQTRESHRDRSRSGRSTPQPLASATGSESEDNEYEKGEKSEKEQAEAEEDFQQSTVHSIRSMLSLSRLFHPSELRSGESTPNPGAGRKSGRDTPSKRISMEQHRIPPKPAKEIVYGDKELLITYLMGVKGPLVELTTVCEETLEAVRKELGEELDIGQELIEGPKKEKENGANIKDGKKEEGKKRWWTRAWLSIGALGKRKTNINNTATSSTTLTDPQASQPNAPTTVPVGRRPLPDYARQISTAVISFDLHEQAHLVRLRRDPAFLAGIIDLGPREELFLVFFFMFSLREVARELRNLADSLRMVKMKNGVVEEEEEREGGSGSVDRVMRKRRKRVFLPKINFRKWVMGTNHSTVQDKGGNSVVHFEDEPRRVEPLYSGDHDVNLALTRSRSLHPVHPDSQPADVPSRPIHRLHTPPAAKSVSFAPPPSDLESLSPLKPPLSIRIRYVLWCQLHRFTAYEVKFGLKMAVAITFLSSLAYFDATMDQFALDRGQWACISILVVMNPAVGGTVNTGFARIIGTIAGAVWGMAAWAIDGPNPYVLAVMGLIMAYPLWYIFLTSTYTKIGSVGIIAYVIVTLSVYTSPGSTDSVIDFAWKRTLTIIIGVLIALFLNWCVWPFVARHQLRKHVARNIYELGELYSMVIATYIHTSEDTSAVATEEEVKLLEKTEKKLQVSVLMCNELLTLTRHEPRLKGPFPTKIWREIVNSVQNLLDRLVSLRSAAKFISLEIQKELCGPLKVYRRDMAAAIVLYFHILAGSLISKTPLPPYFPSARIARIRVINRLRQSSDTMPLTGGAGLEYRNLYWYAYMSSMEEIIEELENLSVLVKLITGKPKLLHRIGAMGDERNKEGQDEGVEDEGAKGRSMGYEG